MSLLLTIFLLVFLTELVSWIGKSVLLDAVYVVYVRIFYSSFLARQRKLKTEILATKAELLKTSAQDQFAKWAKLRRSVDKGISDLEALNSQMSSLKTSFSVKFTTFLWLATTGSQLFISWYNRNAAVFYLPPGWLYGPIEWSLSLPFAPRGSVSVGVWQMACRRVIKVGERVVKELLTVEGAEKAFVPVDEDAKAK